MDIATPEEFEEALKEFAVTWEETLFLFQGLIQGVNDALNNEKATHEEIIERLTFFVTGANKVAFDLIQEGSRMKPRKNFQPALVIAQEKALFEMDVLDWRK